MIGFPCDQFGHQEPGDAAQIRQFCSLDYAVDFPLAAKIDVNGNGAHPLWQWLKHEQRGVLGSEAIKWNFTKFLIGRDGRVLERYAPTTAGGIGYRDRARAGRMIRQGVVLES